ncbi:MAG: ferrous iron transport protein B [Bacteroidetes bacterium]|nr:ferrous iron transport protein B [Bacteroidota bacterium]
MENSKINIVLAGNPNCGKSTLFNALTGLKQKTSNFSGTTVDKKTGEFQINSNITAHITDLPGIYSIYPKSADEVVATDILLNEKNSNFPQKVILVADAVNLKRSLLLCTQIIDLGFPVVLALNMVDIAEAKNIKIDINQLSQFLSIPVVIINARKREGIELLKENLLALPSIQNKKFYEINPAIIQFLDELKPVFSSENSYLNLVKVHRISDSAHEVQNIYKIFDKYEYQPNKIQQRETIERFRKIDYIVAKCVSKLNMETTFTSFSLKADRFLCHPLWGFIFFITLMFTIFQSVFTLADIHKVYIEDFFNFCSSNLNQILPDNWLNGLITEGIIPGLNGLLSFLPQIAILFMFLSLLEDSGYMARVSFIMDSFMRKFGLSGKSIVPLIGGMACAVPSIMATRSIENYRDRLITLLVTPLMSCSARLPVYSVLISLFVKPDLHFGFINMQALMLLVMYMIGFVAAISVAFLLKLFIKQSKKNFFVMELPIYKWPSFRNLRLNVYERSKTFVTEAGLIIICVSIVIWFLGSFGPGNQMKTVNKKYEILSLNKPDSEVTMLNLQKQSELLEKSYAGHFGKLIEPAIKPLGFDWKIGIALLTSFAAREVFVGTMYTIYSIGNEEEDISLRDKMLNEKNPETGAYIYTRATALSLMFFYAFALQCTSTIAVVYRETKRIKWPVIQFVLMVVMAYLSSFIVYHLG